MNDSQYINSNLSGLTISNTELKNASFKNSNVENLKISNSKLANIEFDQNTIFSSDITNEIFISTSLEPTENFLDYLNRVIKNQLIKHFGFESDNRYSKFY